MDGQMVWGWMDAITCKKKKKKKWDLKTVQQQRLTNAAEFHKCDETGKNEEKKDRLFKADALVDLYNCCLLPFLWFPFQSVSQDRKLRKYLGVSARTLWMDGWTDGQTDGRTHTRGGTESLARFVLLPSVSDGG